MIDNVETATSSDTGKPRRGPVACKRYVRRIGKVYIHSAGIGVLIVCTDAEGFDPSVATKVDRLAQRAPKQD